MNEYIESPPLEGYLGVDTGGTFTDFYFWAVGGLMVHKVLSTPDAPELAILQGIAELGLQEPVALGSVSIVHGSTVATNAALERKGVRTVYVGNEGFADLLTLARQNRPTIYALNPDFQEPPVPPELCLEAPCRADHRGQLLRPLEDSAIQLLLQKIEALTPEAIAINLLYSYLRDDEERRIEKALEGKWFVCRSSEVLPEYKEYERGMATWLNAWLGPKVAGYLQRLREGLPNAPLAVMQSSGGTISAGQAARKAVHLLLSGPAGGLSAARYIGQQTGRSRLLTFDMGGTSTDVALIDGDIRLTNEGKLGEYPVSVPMVDMHTIGAGGGSIAYRDAGGMLHVGPESAGASPGPACYGKGGAAPTVTDANVVLGRLRPDGFLGGQMGLDVQAAEEAVRSVAEQLGTDVKAAALGIVALANEHMVNALRVISVQKGFNPGEFELCCFGGAGGLHVCSLAEELGVDRVLVPANGGVLSAFGMLVAPRQRNLSRSIIWPMSEAALAAVWPVVDELRVEGERQLKEEGVNRALALKVSLDCRYQGQSFCLSMPLTEDVSVDQLTEQFHGAHQQTYGHRLPLSVEVVNVRVQIEAAVDPLQGVSLQAPARQASPLRDTRVELQDLGLTEVLWRPAMEVGEAFAGPVIICETVATTLVLPGWRGAVEEGGHLGLSRTRGWPE